MKNRDFFKSVCRLAIPVTLQSMLQSSFSIVDQIMIGQLGSASVAGVGYAGKFASIFSVVISAIGAVAGIMIAQYIGQKNRAEVRRSFSLNLLLGLGIGAAFTALCVLFPMELMGLYTKDAEAQSEAAGYLAVYAASFVPLVGATLLSTLFRCTDRPKIPLFASIVAALLNTGLNYIFIFGKLGLAPMGAKGAAGATVISQCANFVLMLIMLPRGDNAVLGRRVRTVGKFRLRQYLSMLLPILVCEVIWSLGENVYAAIYGHIGTDAGAAMVLTNPVQGLVIGALCGLSQAASVIIGKLLGSAEYDEAYRASKKLFRYGVIGSLILSAAVLLIAPFYVHIYRVEDTVKTLTVRLLYAYALIAPFKVLNMVLGGGILRSGGKTKYVMFIDMIGTWCFGVPLGLLSAFVLNLSVPYVYFLLSLEECVRLAISLAVFRKKHWMQRLDAADSRTST